MNLKAEIDIGLRASNFLKKKYGTVKEMKKYGFDKKVYYRWKEGQAPSPYYLQLLCELGADIVYILTGRNGGEKSG